MIRLNVADIKKNAPYLKAGDGVLLSGELHLIGKEGTEQLMSLIRCGKTTPISVDTSVLLPSSSDTLSEEQTAELYDRGMYAVIGRDAPGGAVCRSLIRNGTLFFIPAPDTDVLSFTKGKERIPLGGSADAVSCLTVTDLPLIVAADSYGHTVFDGGRK